MSHLILLTDLIQDDNAAEIELANAEMSDDLPPPIPNEAKISWLSSIAIAKGDMDIKPVEKEERASVVIRREENAWSRLPQGTIVGDVRIYPNREVTLERNEVQTHQGYNVLNRPTSGMAYAPSYRFIYARFPSHCEGCENRVSTGDLILWYKNRKTIYCGNCDEFRSANVERMANGLSDVSTWGTR